MQAMEHASLRAVPRDVWEHMLPGEPECWDYYVAVEATPPPGFVLGALAVMDRERVLAAAPLFRVSYRIDTPLQGTLRKIGQWLFEHAPRLVSLPVLGLGSPVSDNLTIAFDPALTQDERRAAFAVMLAKLEEIAAAEKCMLIAVKSIDELADSLAPAFAARHYAKVTSVPLVMLDLPYKTYDDYLMSLPAKVRGYMKRKARANARVRMEYRTSIAGLEREIYALYQATLANSSVDYGDFEQLSPEYFSRVLENLGERAQLALCWNGDQLVGFQLSLVDSARIVTKHIGMKYPEARELNLYFLNWLKMIEFAIERRIPLVEMGATTYATKLLFGGRLSRRWLYFRFRSDLMNWMMRPLIPLFDFERNDPELKALAKDKAATPATETA
jgi:hypothetical protein